MVQLALSFLTIAATGALIIVHGNLKTKLNATLPILNIISFKLVGIISLHTDSKCCFIHKKRFISFRGVPTESPVALAS